MPIVLRAEQDEHLIKLMARYTALVEGLLHDSASFQELRATQVRVNHLHEGGRSGPPFAQDTMTLGHFFEKYFDDYEYYLQQLPVHEYAPLYRYMGGKDIQRVPFGVAPLDLHCGMFAGAADIATSLHYDRKHFAQGEAPVSNIFVQVSGTKRFDLIHPDLSPFLYARGLPLPADACQPGSTGMQAASTPEDALPAPITISPHVSRLGIIDPLTFDKPEATSAWPGFAEAYKQRLVVQLQPGDCLYVPPRWWHATYANTQGLALNWWFTPAH